MTLALDTNNMTYTKEQKIESLRHSLIKAGFDMASSQAESMADDLESWGDYMVDGKINPHCIDICDQASHSFYNNELDIWFEPDESIFSEEYTEWGINELIERYGISDDEVFDLLYEGASNFIKTVYGERWKTNYSEPVYKY